MPVVPFTPQAPARRDDPVEFTAAHEPWALMAAAQMDADGRLMKFDPEGSGYDMDTAKAAGLKPDDTGHWPSRDPESGQILKGRNHKTFYLTEEGEAKAGYKIRKGDNGRYYSFEDK